MTIAQAALVEGFATRWLELSKLGGVVPDTHLYPEFDENLRDAMGKRRSCCRKPDSDDRSVAELLSANYTFANERLAQHYDIPNVYGNHFRRVTIDDGLRGGLLGHGSLLTVTSYPNRTSVVLRGQMAAGEHARRAAASAAARCARLKEPVPKVSRSRSGQRMELHRKNPVCASCHQRMDPLGFSLENFDAIGKWREESDGAPVDPAALLPDGTPFEGMGGLRNLLVSHKEDFVGTLGEKLLAYAVGRGVEYYDQPAIRKIARDAAQHEYRWSAVVLGIVKSAPFSMGMPLDAQTAGARRGTCEEREMIISKKAIPRRTMLRGIGAILALPLLDSMVPALRRSRRRPASR